MQLQVDGQLDLAETIFRSILEVQPKHGAANYCIGMLLVQVRRPADGLPYLLTALNESPQIADYWLGYLEALLLLDEIQLATNTLGIARQHGLAGRAADDFAVRLDAKLRRGAESATPAASNAPAARKPARASRRREAEAIARQEARVLDLVKQRRFLDALPLAREMTARFPECGAGWKILAAMVWAAGSQEEAIAAMRASVRLLPEDAEAHSNLGTALNKMQRLDEAEKWLRRALEIDANFAPAHARLGDNHQLQGRYAEAEASFRRAIALSAGDRSAEADAVDSALLFMMNHNPGVDADTLFAEHCRVGAYLERSVRRCGSPRPEDADPDRCLEVGLVSADLRNHAVASFVEPVLREWQQSRNLRITAYYAHPREDDVSQRLRDYVWRWFRVFDVLRPTIAQKIADDRIDILVDLSGHTSMHRLGVFAHKPAPVQASWLGYPGTTGLHSMDYYLTDKRFLPPGKFNRHFTEQLAYVPAVWTFQPFDSAPPVNGLPALRSGHMTFGSFNRLGKINQATVQLWSRLLGALPESRIDHSRVFRSNASIYD